MLTITMTPMSVRRFFAVLLAVLVTVGLSLSVAQAGNMSLKMSIETGMTGSGHDSFHDCDGGDIGKAKAMMCATICAASAFATVPQITPVAVAETMMTIALPEDQFLVGTGSPPDPYPPRSAHIS
jgi:hypothetical protein